MEEEKVVEEIENRIIDILYNILPRVVSYVSHSWDDYYLKIMIPKLWLTVFRLSYGITRAPSEECLLKFFGKIDEEMAPYQQVPTEIFDKRFVIIVQSIIEGEKKKMLWGSVYGDAEGINKEFQYTCERMREIKREYLEQKAIMYR